MNRRRVLFVGEGVTLSHVVRPLVLAQVLDPASYEVHIAAAECYRHLAEDKNINFHPLVTATAEEFQERLDASRPLFPPEQIARYVEAELDLLRRLRPDLIVGDFRLSLGISSEILDIPYATIVDAHWSPYAKIPFPVPEVWISRMVGLRVSRLMVPIFAQAIFWRHARSFNAERRRRGLKAAGSLREIYSYGRWVLYVGLPSLIPLLRMPSRHRFLGPISWEPDLPLPDWWGTIAQEQPVIYVTVGSSGAREFPSLLVRSLDGMPVTVVIATSGREFPAPLSKNFYTADFLPASRVLQKARLMICNGGSGACHQAFAAGVPVLGLPSNMDQFYVMESIVRRGGGALMRPKTASATDVRRAVEKLLTQPKYAATARELRSEIQEFDSARRFAQFIKETCPVR